MDMNTIKKTGSTNGQPNKLGGGGRFKQAVAKTGSPALAAFIGRKMYGKKKMTKMAVAGKKTANKDNEMDNGVAESPAHEKAESKKKEASEN